MLVRFATVVGVCVTLSLACSGESKEFGGTGGGTGRAGSGGTSGQGGSSGAAGKGASSGTGGAAGSGTGGGVAIDDAPVTVAVDLCDKIYECCSADDIMNIQGIGTTKGQCELAVAVVLQLRVNAVKPSIMAGRVVYDGSALTVCLDDYGNRSCDMLRSIESFDCPGLIVPKQAAGDACGVSAECIDGFCDGGSSAADPVGTCAAVKAAGAGCTANEECESQYCDADGACGDAPSLALCGG